MCSDIKDASSFLCASHFPGFQRPTQCMRWKRFQLTVLQQQLYAIDVDLAMLQALGKCYAKPGDDRIQYNTLRAEWRDVGIAILNTGLQRVLTYGIAFKSVVGLASWMAEAKFWRRISCAISDNGIQLGFMEVGRYDQTALVGGVAVGTVQTS